MPIRVPDIVVKGSLGCVQHYEPFPERIELVSDRFTPSRGRTAENDPTLSPNHQNWRTNYFCVWVACNNNQLPLQLGGQLATYTLMRGNADPLMRQERSALQRFHIRERNNVDGNDVYIEYQKTKEAGSSFKCDTGLIACGPLFRLCTTNTDGIGERRCGNQLVVH